MQLRHSSQVEQEVVYSFMADCVMPEPRNIA